VQVTVVWNSLEVPARRLSARPRSPSCYPCRSSWLSRLDEGGLSQRFFGGAVTFATLMPMRAIPFRHVCLLGMNDGAYPLEIGSLSVR